MAEKIEPNNDNIDSSNIFDDFVQDSNLIKEVDKIKTDKNKDKFYYFTKVWKVFQILFWFLIILTVLLYSYISIQNNKDFSNSNLLDPFCYIFLWDIENTDVFCSSILSIKSNYTKKLSVEKAEQSKNILKILEKLYEIENFTKIKEVLFLVDKTSTKLPVLKILEEFDNLLNKFDKIDKQKIQCNNLKIESKLNIILLECYASSAWFETWLMWFDWTPNSPLSWTSISAANSFINYIGKKSTFFTIIDRQKIFRSENLLWKKSGFTNGTPFKLKLKYNLK